VCNTEAFTKWMVLPHSLYSPDLAASDFHLFGPLKDSVNDGVLLVICQWLQMREIFSRLENMFLLKVEEDH
jgi:hypothetical protein